MISSLIIYILTKKKVLMNKFKTITIALCMAFASSVAYAEYRIGISAMAVSVDTSGSETLRDSGNKTNHSISEDTVVPSLFFEIVEGDTAIGIDYVPVQEMGSGTGDDDDAETSGANKAEAEVSGHMSVYLLQEMGSNVFLKAGVVRATIKTEETLATGDSYGNDTVYGLTAGIGYTMDQGEYFLRGELNYTDYQDVQINSAGGSTIDASVDSVGAKLSVGRSF